MTAPEGRETAGRRLTDKEWAAENGIVCHAPDGPDRCEGCSHYQGRGKVCVYAPPRKVTASTANVAAMVEALKAARNELMMLGDPGSTAEDVIDQIDHALSRATATGEVK